MKKKIIKGILITLSAIVSMTAISSQAVQAETNSESIAERNTAKELGEISPKTESDWTWGIGEGTEDAIENYQMRQSKSFFSSINTDVIRSEELFNRNNNIGDPVPQYGEITIFRF